jgi:hypothetical protein
MTAGSGRLLAVGVRTGAAYNRLLDDYVRYHVALLVVGGFFTLLVGLLCLFAWTRFRRSRSDSKGWTFERRTYFAFGVVSLVVGLGMLLIFAANLTSVLNPQQGLAGAIGTLGTPQAGTHLDKLSQTFNAWLQSGSPHLPALIHAKIDQRLAWQRPKAIICSVLLILFVAVSVGIWRWLLGQSRTTEARSMARRRAMVCVGALTGIACLLLMVMVVANTQASFAPLTLTLLYG